MNNQKIEEGNKKQAEQVKIAEGRSLEKNLM